jgi:hypothetical protein
MAQYVPRGWPPNFEALAWQLARFYACGPEPFWRMTGRDLLQGTAAANEMIEAQIKASKHGWRI